MKLGVLATGIIEEEIIEVKTLSISFINPPATKDANGVNGGDFTLSVSILPAGVDDYAIFTTPSSSAIATISVLNETQVTVSPTVLGGDFVLRATSAMDPLIYDEITINFVVRAEGLEITNAPTRDMDTFDDPLQLEHRFTPVTVTNDGVTYSSDNASVATVTPSGLLTVVGVGTVNITVTSDDDNSITDTVSIDVIQGYPPNFWLEFPYEGTLKKAGSFVGISGNGYVVGGSSSNYDTHYVWRYSESSNTWARKTLTINNPDLFARGITFSEDGLRCAAIYAHYGNAGGYLGIYKWNGSSWALEKGFSTYMPPSNWLNNDNVSMTTAGDRVAIGGTDNVYVYVRSGTTWSLESSFNDAGDQRTRCLSISGDGNWIIVGSSYNKRAYVYSRSGTVWSHEHTFISPDEGDSQFPSDDFGEAVDINYDGTYAMISDPGPSSGFVFYFRRSGSSWTSAGSSQGWENHGRDVSVDDAGIYNIIGNIKYNDAYIMKYSSKKSTFNFSADNFGRAVAMSHDGNAVVISQPGYNNGRLRVAFRTTYWG